MVKKRRVHYAVQAQKSYEKGAATAVNIRKGSMDDIKIYENIVEAHEDDKKLYTTLLHRRTIPRHIHKR